MKTLLGKYFITTAVLVLLSLMVLGGGLSFQLYKYSIGEKHESLENTAMLIAEIADEYMIDYSILRERVFRSMLSFLTNGGKNHVLICDTTGQVLLSSDDTGAGFVGIYLDAEITQKLFSDSSYVNIGTLNGIYSGQNYTVGIPIKSEFGHNLGGVFVTTSMVTVRELLYDILKMFLFSAIFVFLISAITCYLVVRSMTKPLKRISTTAREFAMGKYDARVPVTTNDEIGELSAAFNGMAGSIEKAEKLRRSFLENVSHELRSPMTSIGGFVDGILDGTVPKEKERHYLEIISSEIRRLNRLVSRMLDITRLQAADYPQNLTKFDFCEVIRRAVFGFEKRIEEKSINIDISLSEYTIEVNANEDAIYQVIYNLIDNAIKFTANNETIVIKANSSGGKAEFKI
ncbi:MAG: HAMP domain-containing histidine kinase, partial [Clostridiales bacterium]|nr:HAMP domain-containing histidine kinase [Clostridiales bacterium]